MQSSFQGSTVLKINDNLPSVAMNLGDASYPGFYTVQRHGYGTAQETAVWTVNGTYYSDHRHEDSGAVSMYALGAPLSVDWGSLYSPRTSSPAMHSVVLPESALGQSWTAQDVTIEGPLSPWKTASQNAFESFDNSSRTVSQMQGTNGSVWTRSV